MADRGTKRRCAECGAAFYDMGRTPIVCPKCGTTHEPQVLLKSDGRQPRKSRAPAPPPPTVDTEPAEAPEPKDDEAADEAADDEEDDALLPDDDENEAPPDEPEEEAERER
jgi:hypothetical protein